MNDCTIPATTCDTFDTFDTCDPFDHSGGYDAMVPAAPLSMAIDSDGDGAVDTTVTDLDGDGIADAYDWVDPSTGMGVFALDSDGDGLLDVIAVDADGDGSFDEVSVDADGDGTFETTIDTTTGEETTADEATDPGALPEDMSTADTLSVDDDAVHGEPMAEIPYHQAQVGPNDCLPTSVAMVLSEATGTEVPQAELVDLANSLGLLGPSGMSMDGGVTLLEHYGIDAEVRSGSVDDLRELLDAGTPVIIGLDADDLYGEGDQPFADDFVSGHAVVITGIDDEAGLVYINDPAFPDGAGVAVPIADFEDAWQDGDNVMIVADTDAAPTGDDVAAGATEQADDRGLSLIDVVLLPLTLIVR